MPATPRKRILIIDDDAQLRMGLAVRLQASGYETVCAADGMGAVAQARRSAPDLILLDMGLPAGDGFVVMERLASLVPLAGIPIIIVSARDLDSYADRALKAGARAVVQKPVDNRHLLALIRRELHEPAEEPALPAW